VLVMTYFVRYTGLPPTFDGPPPIFDGPPPGLGPPGIPPPSFGIDDHFGTEPDFYAGYEPTQVCAEISFANIFSQFLQSVSRI